MIIIQQLLWILLNGSWSKEKTNGCVEQQKSKRRKKNVLLNYQINFVSTCLLNVWLNYEFILWDFQKVTHF